MAGYLFPLLLKLKLAFNKQYVLDDPDKQRLRSIEKQLAATDWLVTTRAK